jgi:hypothetical protein
MLLALACSGAPADDTDPGGDDTAGDTDDTDDSGNDTAAPREVSLATADAAIVGSESYAVGNAVAFGGDEDGDGYDEAVLSASFLGWTCVVRGPPAPGVHALEDADACYTGEADLDYAGQAIDAGRDVTGDDVPDLLVGAIANDELGPEAGKVYLVPGPWVSGSLADVTTSFLGESKADYAGSAVAFLGDLDGDGAGDLAIGAMANDAGGSGAGKAYVFHGPFEARTHSLSEAAANIAGTGVTALLHGAPVDGDGVGSVLAAAGDLDGDGLADLLLGANGSDLGGKDAGAAAVFLGPVADGDHAFTEADRLWVGEVELQYVGDAVASAGDLDGDGLADVLVSGDTGGNGTTWVFYGPGAVGSTAVSTAPLRFEGERLGDLAGAAVSAAGDTDGDGTPDLLIGAYGRDVTGLDAGGAYLLRGPFAPGVVSLADADRSWLGEGQSDDAGRAVAGGGDLDGDGRADLLVGAVYADTGGSYGGEAYLILSP